MLVIVPQGCDDAGAIKLIKKWVENNFVPPPAFANHKAICIEIVSDGIQSSNQFASSVSAAVSRCLSIEVENERDEFPTDVLQNSIEAATAAGAYPVIFIHRFHAFASIRDGGMTSMLSRLRTLEGNAQMTTLAFSPVSYDGIRQMMGSEQPFLNSVYGDMHDQAVMRPLSRDEFLAEASARGIPHATAHRLFSIGGGPDSVFLGLLDLWQADKNFIVRECADKVGPVIDRFISRAFLADRETDLLLENLALGTLNAAQEAYLLNHPLGDYLCKRGSNSKLICASPIIAQRVLSRGLPTLSLFRSCLSAAEAGDFLLAADLAGGLSDRHLRLVAFKELLLVLGALTPKPGRGLLGIDWLSVEEAVKRLKLLKNECIAQFVPWIESLDEALRLLTPVRGGGRLQIDELTSRSSDVEVRKLLLHMLESAIGASRKLPEPLLRVQFIVNIPEAILQSIAMGFCSIDFTNAPDHLPLADYETFFGRGKPFEAPRAGQKIALTALLVIVPAVLAEKKTPGISYLINPKAVQPLQQKLVDAVRNPASHTIVEFQLRDAEFLESVCSTWISEWAEMEGMASLDALPIRSLRPSPEHLRQLLFGYEADHAIDNIGTS
jgi:hypothetical protein